MADKNYFEKVKASESAGKTNAKNKQSSASGLYQFTKGTWEGLGYNWNDRFNPKLQEEAMIKYTQKADDQFTKALGRKPTDADRYGNHFLGAGTYIKALKAGDNALISNVVSSAAYNANKSIMQKNGKPITVGELKNWLNKKMGSTTTEVSQTSQQEEQTPYISPIDFNTPEYSGMTFSEEEPEQEQTPQEQSLQASQDLLEESFLEEADAMLAQSQTQPIQEYEPAPQYNVELNPIEYQPIAQFQNGGKFADLDAKMAKTRSQLNRKPTPQLSSRERPKEIVRESTQTTFRNEAGRQVNTKPNEQISTKYNAERQRVQDVAERKAKIADSIKAQDEDIIGNSNWREVLARETQATGDKFRIFPEENSLIDNYLNPMVMIGDMASNLGQAPLRAQQSDSYMPYVTAIGAPLAVGAMAGYGAKGNGQFVNNLLNPLAGAEEITNKGIRLIHYSDNPHLRFEDIDLFRPGTSQRKRSMQSKSTEELPGGFYTTMDENSKFMGGNLGYEMYMPENSKILDLASTGRVTDRLPIKELQQYKKEGYDLIKGRNMLRQDEYIPLNKEKLTGWSQFTQDRRGLNKMQQGGQIPVSSRGVYDFPNQEVIVPTEDGEITMKNINYPIIGTDEFGNRQLMQPDGEYQFPGKIIHEIPQTKRLKNKRFK